MLTHYPVPGDPKAAKAVRTEPHGEDDVTMTFAGLGTVFGLLVLVTSTIMMCEGDLSWRVFGEAIVSSIAIWYAGSAAQLRRWWRTRRLNKHIAAGTVLALEQYPYLLEKLTACAEAQSLPDSVIAKAISYHWGELAAAAATACPPMYDPNTNLTTFNACRNVIDPWINVICERAASLLRDQLIIEGRDPETVARETEIRSAGVIAALSTLSKPPRSDN